MYTHGSPDETKLQHTATWSATAWPPTACIITQQYSTTIVLLKMLLLQFSFFFKLCELEISLGWEVSVYMETWKFVPGQRHDSFYIQDPSSKQNWGTSMAQQKSV
jgi:hypothetical protein